MIYEKYLMTEKKQNVGDWIKQERGDATVYAIILEILKNGGYKVLMFDDSYGVAKMGSSKNWHPSAVPAKKNEVPKDILQKMSKKLAKTKYSNMKI